MRWTDIEDRWWTQSTGETKTVWPTVSGSAISRGSFSRSTARIGMGVCESQETVRTDRMACQGVGKNGEAAGVSDFQARDLRRTVATRIAAAGVDPRTVDLILNHKERRIIRVYNRYQFDKEKQQAWALQLLSK